MLLIIVIVLILGVLIYRYYNYIIIK